MSAPTIFLVEDDPTLRALCTELLEDEGYMVAIPPEAAILCQIVQQQPAIVLLDTSGAPEQRAGLSRQLKAVGRPPAVILLSTDPHVRDLQVPADADAVLQKPFDLDDLVALLAHFTSTPRYRTP